jgi:hypothetical protein
MMKTNRLNLPLPLLNHMINTWTMMLTYESDFGIIERAQPVAAPRDSLQAEVSIAGASYLPDQVVTSSMKWKSLRSITIDAARLHSFTCVACWLVIAINATTVHIRHLTATPQSTISMGNNTKDNNNDGKSNNDDNKVDGCRLLARVMPRQVTDVTYARCWTLWESSPCCIMDYPTTITRLHIETTFGEDIWTNVATELPNVRDLTLLFENNDEEQAMAQIASASSLSLHSLTLQLYNSSVCQLILDQWSASLTSLKLLVYEQVDDVLTPLLTQLHKCHQLRHLSLYCHSKRWTSLTNAMLTQLASFAGIVPLTTIELLRDGVDFSLLNPWRAYGTQIIWRGSDGLKRIDGGRSEWAYEEHVID